ncbi:hypothetical protein [Bradyrhizobium sp. SZCCHNRI1002]|uniref:hypothetical protein n=1 Tax=Bradyrhizobium sp. SZCCHNRI1002 TaxID=3057274 RepID=UPI0028E232FB|nr:hypothetical protein [Bradyrhizobium sp. SZCCHNRI1002]
MNATVAPLPLTQERQAELFALRKTQWSAAEYRALADRYADAVDLFQRGIANNSMAQIRSAYLSLAEIADQTKQLNDGLMHAIQAMQEESKR